MLNAFTFFHLDSGIEDGIILFTLLFLKKFLLILLVRFLYFAD